MTAKAIYLFITALAALTAFFGWKLTARGAYESAEYTVIEADGEFELREYPELMLVTTSTQFEPQGDDGSFMRLFRYISGANEKKQKVAMTTPVFMRPDTADEAGLMGFVIPKEVAADEAPKPVGDLVNLKTRPGGRFAVIRFRGRMDRKSLAAAETRLRAWMTAKGLSGKGELESAGYDPPWTPGPLRRNELLIRLE